MTVDVSRTGEGRTRSSSAELGSWFASGPGRTFWITLLLILVLAASLRGVQLKESLWLDELHTAWIVADGWAEIPWRARFGNQSPLYFYFVAAATGIGGLNELSLRLPSVFAGVALVMSAALLVTRWTGSRAAGLLAALLLALDRNCIFYSQEARPYAWVQLFGLINTAFFLRILVAPSRRSRAGWVVTAVVVFYLHYTAILLLAAQLVAYGLLSLVPAWRPVYRWRQLAADGGVVVLGMLPSIPHLMQIAARRDAWSLFISRRLGLGEVFSLFPLEIYLLLPAIICVMAWLVVKTTKRWRGPGAMSAGLARGDWCFSWERWSFGSADSVDPRQLVVLSAWLFVPLILAWILTVCDVARVFFLRYLVVSAAVPALLSAILLPACPGSLSRFVCSIALAAALVVQNGFVQQFQSDGRVIGDRRQDWRAAISLLRREVAADHVPVFVRSGLIEADRLSDAPTPRLREYCLLPVHGIYRLDLPAEDVIPLPTSRSGELNRTHAERIIAAGQAWFLVVGAPRTVDHISASVQRAITRKGAARVALRRHAFGDVAVMQMIVNR